jgi:hypothetical protein
MFETRQLILTESSIQQLLSHFQVEGGYIQNSCVLEEFTEDCFNDYGSGWFLSIICFDDPCCQLELSKIAKDTWISGYLIESALTAGLISVGVDVTLVGPMPTPAVPMLIHQTVLQFNCSHG